MGSQLTQWMSGVNLPRFVPGSRVFTKPEGLWEDAYKSEMRMMSNPREKDRNGYSNQESHEGITILQLQEGGRKDIALQVPGSGVVGMGMVKRDRFSF